MFPCTGDDEWVAIACEDDAQRAALAGVVGATTDAAIEAWTSTRSIAEVEDALQAVGVPVHGVQNTAACWPTRSSSIAGHYLTVEHPVHGQCIVEGARVGCHGRRPWCDGPTRQMGEHNDHVLHDLLGYDEDHVTELVIAGALG